MDTDLNNIKTRLFDLKVRVSLLEDAQKRPGKIDTTPNDLKTTLRDLENRLSALEEGYRITQRKQEMTCVNVLKKIYDLVVIGILVFLGTLITMRFLLNLFLGI